MGPPKVVETGRAQVLWGLQMQADKQVMVNQLDERLDVAIPSDRIIRKKETDKIPVTERSGRRCGQGSCWIDVVTGALAAVTPPSWRTGSSRVQW